MKLSYKYKLKPNTKQQKALTQMFGCTRYIYNWGLDIKMQAYKATKEGVSYNELSKRLTALRKDKNYTWLKEASRDALQQSLRNLDCAYENFFHGRKSQNKIGYPKFKSKHNSKNVVKYYSSVQIDFNKWKIRLPKIGWVNMCYNKSFDLSTVKVGVVTVSKDRCNNYWCSVNVDDGRAFPPKAKVEKATTVGIDLGIKNFITTSDGITVRNPKFLEKSLKKLTALQKRFSRRQKDSNRYERARLALAKCHKHITNCKNDFLHKLTTSLVIGNYNSFALENLNIPEMEQNKNLSQSIMSASWYEFIRQLTYKAERCGKNIIHIDRFKPSSKTCSICGWYNDELTLKDREWTCQKCGAHHDRDINAAINIKNMAIDTLIEIHPCVGGEEDAEGRGYKPCETSKVQIIY